LNTIDSLIKAGTIPKKKAGGPDRVAFGNAYDNNLGRSITQANVQVLRDALKARLLPAEWKGMVDQKNDLTGFKQTAWELLVERIVAAAHNEAEAKAPGYLAY
jgi:hypothetical protein